MNLTLNKSNYRKTLQYFKELGDMMIVYEKEKHLYLVGIADCCVPCDGDLYVAVPVEQSTIDAYEQKQITARDIQRQADTLYLGKAIGPTFDLAPTTFHALKERDILWGEASFYDEMFDPDQS